MDIQTIENLAPDQSSLTAASKLTRASKWGLRARDMDDHLLWGECQGSGANPYRVMGDIRDLGYKCTCPSRKFPCKHVLALFWMYASEPGDFAVSPDSPPDWVVDWLSRRRKPADSEKKEAPRAPVNIRKAAETAQSPEEDRQLTPAQIEKKKETARRRQENITSRLLDGLGELELWVSDQLSLGLGALVSDPSGPCRKIAARMVDAGAPALAGRIDELPSFLSGLPGEYRSAAAVMELGRWVIMARRFRADTGDVEIYSELARAVTREELMARTDIVRISGIWEVVGEQVATQRDGLVRQSTWILQLDSNADRPRFAMLLDYYPASAGRRSASFTPGDRFKAVVAYYPGASTIRAVIQERMADEVPETAWPVNSLSSRDVLIRSRMDTPWSIRLPVLLPAGRIVMSRRGRFSWRDLNGDLELLMADLPAKALLGADMNQSVFIWNGIQATLLAAHTSLGRYFS